MTASAMGYIPAIQLVSLLGIRFVYGRYSSIPSSLGEPAPSYYSFYYDYCARYEIRLVVKARPSLKGIVGSHGGR